MRRALCLLGLLAAAGAAAAQDYAREARWRDEVLASLVVGDAVQLTLPGGREFLGLYAPADGAKPAVLLVHGVGVHPDHGLIGVLRVALAERGHPTLSIQMPVQTADARPEDYYPGVFPQAVERIRSGARWLGERGHRRLALLGHSMGSWMANAYFEDTADSPFMAWVCIGLGGDFAGMGNVRVPVLDVFGENDLPQVLRAAPRRRAALDGVAGSKQVRINGADHHYTGRENALAAAIDTFLAALK